MEEIRQRSEEKKKREKKRTCILEDLILCSSEKYKRE